MNDLKSEASSHNTMLHCSAAKTSRPMHTLLLAPWVAAALVVVEVRSRKEHRAQREEVDCRAVRRLRELGGDDLPVHASLGAPTFGERASKAEIEQSIERSKCVLNKDK